MEPSRLSRVDERMRGHHPYADCLDALECDDQLADRHPLHQAMALWNATMLPNYVLAAERLEMAFAVEVPGDIQAGPIFRADPTRYSKDRSSLVELYDLQADRRP